MSLEIQNAKISSFTARKNPIIAHQKMAHVIVAHFDVSHSPAVFISSMPKSRTKGQEASTTPRITSAVTEVPNAPETSLQTHCKLSQRDRDVALQFFLTPDPGCHS